LLLAACAAPPPNSAPVLAGRIWDVRAGRFVEESELAQRVREARYVLLGEVLDNPSHHTLRARLIRELPSGTEIFFEQFDRAQDAALREAQKAGDGADALARAGKLDESWNWPLYRPLVEAALAGKHTVRAANLPGSATRRIATSGKLDGGDAELENALLRSGWSDAEEKALRAEIFESHCRALPERVAPAMALAQRARDATMELALAEAPLGAALLAGNGHVRRDLGVPRYLPQGAAALSVGFLEVREDEPDARGYVQGAGGEPAFDYVWFTARQARPDPCEAFRKR
jgi:uncharacterized iron-regulated protein